jgi:hypothetical protein
MRRGRSFTISGTLIDSSGEPVTGGMVFLTRFESNGSGSTPVRMHEGGRFAFENVLTGEYAIEASIGGDVRPADRRATESAFVPVRVDASDVSGLVVQMATTATVVGRVVVEEGSGPIPVRPGNAPLLVHARLSGDRLPGSGSARGGHVGDDRLFYLDRMFGRRTISVANVPPGWFVKSIRYEEEDISDMAVEIRANRDPSKLEIVLSTRGAAVSGRVFDERGEAVRGARVLLIPANPAKWLGNDLAAATASAAGEYSTGPQRAGDYLIVALRPGVPLPEIRDPERIAALTAGAERVTLTANEQRTVDLRVLSGPHP